MKKTLTLPVDQLDLDAIRSALEERWHVLSDGNSADEAALGYAWAIEERERVKTLLHKLPSTV